MSNANVGTSKGERQRRKRGSQQLHQNRDGSYSGRVTTMVDGARVRKMVPLGTKDRTVARAKLRALRSGKLAADAAGAQQTLGAYFEAWQERYPCGSSWVDSQRFRDHVPDDVKALPLNKVRPDHIRDLMAEAAKSGLSPSTVHKVREVLNRCLRRAWKDELISENPVARTDAPKPGKRRQRVIPTDAELALACQCKSVPETIRAIWIFQRFTGARSGDACALQWTDINFSTGEIMVPNEKDEPRQLHMDPALAAFLLTWHAQHGRPTKGWVFPNRYGGRFAKRGTSFAGKLRRALRVSGVTRPELFEATERTMPTDDHSIRRLFASSLAAAGASLQQAMALTGHKSAEVHSRYLRATNEMRTVPQAAIGRFASEIGNSLPISPSPDDGQGGNLEVIQHLGSIAQSVELRAFKPIGTCQCGATRRDDSPDNGEREPLRAAASHHCLSPLPISRRAVEPDGARDGDCHTHRLAVADACRPADASEAAPHVLAAPAPPDASSGDSGPAPAMAGRYADLVRALQRRDPAAVRRASALLRLEALALVLGGRRRPSSLALAL